MAFRSLRSWLLLSYTGLILLVLAIILVAALLIGSLPRIRYLPTFQQLEAISLISQNEIRRLQSDEQNSNRVLEVLEQTAVQNDVRVLVVTLQNREIRFDSGDGWEGEPLERVISFETNDPNSLAGLYVRPDGARWLIYSRSLINNQFGRFLIVYAKPEPSRLSYFLDLRLGQLLLSSAGVAFVVAIFLSLAVAAAVARPLQKVAQAAEAIAEGEYEQKIDLRGPTEVRSMANSFNVMSRQVAHTRRAQRDFVANVSHDLKTPITSIQGWSQAILDGTAVTPQEQSHAAQVIHDEAERMARMVQQLLDLARIESGQLELVPGIVDLCQLADDVYRNLSVKAEGKKVQLVVEKTAVPPIHGDADRLMQIMSNLVDNAINHTPAGGEVTLTVKPASGGVYIEVKDNGKGIPPEVLERIFERFYQVDASRQNVSERGTGLGLAIVQELVGLHNGRISAESVVGEGSVFRVWLPVSDQ